MSQGLHTSMRTPRLLMLITIIAGLTAGIAIVASHVRISRPEISDANVSTFASSVPPPQVLKQPTQTESRIEGPRAPRTHSNWKSDFTSAGDLGEFVVRATTAADAGDGAAAYYAGEALAQCSLIVRTIQKGLDEDGYIALITSKFTPPELTAIQRTQYKRCASLATRTEFAEWSREMGGKMTGGYWLNLAVKHGSAIAKAEQIARSALSVRNTEQIEQLRSYAADIVRAGEPEALFHLGSVMLNTNIAKDPVYGLALALAACDSGYDCSAKEHNSGWSHCDLPQHCDAPRSFQQFAQDTFPPALFSRAYALAQQYRDALHRNNTDELSPFARLDGLEGNSQDPLRTQ